MDITWRPEELKLWAREAMSRNVFRCALVGLVLELSSKIWNLFSSTDSLWVSLLIILLDLLVLSVLEIGCAAFFLANRSEPAGLNCLTACFDSGYWRNVAAQVLRALYVVLWSLLFIIPGIIKHYEYRMVPFLLAEHPEMSRQEAFEESRYMMEGNKLAVLLLDISFVGWVLPAIAVYLLVGNPAGMVTAAVVNGCFLHPYLTAAKAELYHALKNQHLKGE